MTLLTLEDLNQMPSPVFTQSMQPLLEHCDWVLPELDLHRPFQSIDEMKALLRTILLFQTPQNLQLKAVLNHPKLSVQKPQAGFSQSEQKSVGLDQLSAQEFADFKLWNEQYEAKHGFPFIIAVTGLDKASIFEEIQRRLELDSRREFAQAMQELVKIAQLRVGKLIES